jgi:hypothetical protein
MAGHPIHSAAANADLEMAKLLVENGALLGRVSVAIYLAQFGKMGHV